jgi:hypothetical protein
MMRPTSLRSLVLVASIAALAGLSVAAEPDKKPDPAKGQQPPGGPRVGPIMPGGGAAARPGGLMPGGGMLRLGAIDDPRLGASVAKPSDTIVEQLGLTRGQGLVLERVQAQAAAGQGGLENHDIILELDGKAVPSNADEFAKFVDAVKAKTPVDVVVLRKGKKETVKGLTLPEVDPNARKQQNRFGPRIGIGNMPGGGALPNPPAGGGVRPVQGGGGAGPVPPGGGVVPAKPAGDTK